ncbi:MCE family protein [Hoyosella sp. G463]|uniref:MCE family protein n=1 Tax=Lolliginicoccus lacisalsi TaxID=2742202 RepID=A0A927JDR2_9ACTN|nr:MCE family protein [Lolliginicoccus lacisalsi]MBD8507253.1 MCE family protein [Lolliginicoccus lacisalsi]
MSDHPAPQERPQNPDHDDEFTGSWRHVGLGVVLIVMIASFIATTMLIYRNAFTERVAVTLLVGTVGNALSAGSDVKLGGALVGEVTGLRLRPGFEVEVSLAIDGSSAHLVPSTATARIVPKTLFGERYVQLVDTGIRSRPIRPGDVIEEDASGSAVDASRMYDVFYELLEAVPPAELATTLGSINAAMAGRGERIGEMMDRFSRMAASVNSEAPALEQQLGDIAELAETYSDVLPELVVALDELRGTTRTIVERRDDLAAMHQALIGAGRDSAAILEENQDRIIAITADSRETLEILARYSPAFGCSLAYFAGLRDRLEVAFGKGKGMPGLNLTIELANPRGNYVPNQDEARFFDERGPICYEPVDPAAGRFPQYPGGAPNTGAYAVPSRNPGQQDLAELPDPLALAAEVAAVPGSEAEGEARRALYGLAAGIDPVDVPGWTTLIGAPLLRGPAIRLVPGE